LPSAPLKRIGRYEILSLLGAGGMGEVYLAQDTKLDRKLALKVLATDMSGQDLVRRFIQEAKAASALNHPNILTIYEIDEIDSAHFIATEFVEGETLRERIRKSPLSLRDAIDIGVQVANALCATHSVGIVHRDIKPENIMVRRNGYVKVLDFGLAKLTELRGADTEAPTRAMVHTDAGTVMGTSHYMSPEQARGRNVDRHTDIWSLGVVLYEMAAGRVPFQGESATDVLSAITKVEPLPLARYTIQLPAEFEWIVMKALRKDESERYQTAKELESDLRALKQRLEFEAQLERSIPPDRLSAAVSAADAKTLISRPATPAQGSLDGTVLVGRPTEVDSATTPRVSSAKNDRPRLSHRGRGRAASARACSRAVAWRCWWKIAASAWRRKPSPRHWNLSANWTAPCPAASRGRAWACPSPRRWPNCTAAVCAFKARSARAPSSPSLCLPVALLRRQ